MITLFLILSVLLSILLHEVGHGMGVVFTSQSHAHIYMGSRGEDNQENFRIGRRHFHLQPSHVDGVSGKLN